MRYLVTSALPYINGVKHIGNLIGSMLPADVFARYLRQAGEEVLLICATDEHGTPAEIAALKAGLDVASYCRQQHTLQVAACRGFGLSFDHFGRSSSPQNRDLTQYIYRRLDEEGFIEEREMQLVYSLEDGRFLPDRYITGTCPKCGYASARGDQCENCTSLLDPTDLIDARSAISGSARLEIRTSKHLFLKQSLLAKEIRAWVDEHPMWPVVTRSIALKWLNEGIRDRCITRDLTWGVPVPRKGFEDKVFYVWFDAPIEYIGATREWADREPDERSWERWWRCPEDVVYVQFMAKDNVPFHTITWPATMLGTRETWVTAETIKAFNWLTYCGDKFSTSQKRGIFMDSALEILPADYWRYFLLEQAPESSDSNFTWERFGLVVNKDLADKFGNFVNRTLKLTASRYGTKVPAGGQPGEAEARLIEHCAERLEEYQRALRATGFRKAIRALRDLWTAGNVYLDERAPWDVIREDREAGAVILRTAINLIGLYAKAAWPVIPFTSDKLFDALRFTQAEREAPMQAFLSLTAIGADRAFEIPPLLFRKLERSELEKWRQAYEG